MDNNKYIYNVTTDEFQSLVIERSSVLPVLVDFWADWCQPCQTLMPVLDAVQKRFPEKFYLAKVDTDAEQMLAMQLGIRSLPTVVLFKDGQPVDNFMGMRSENEIVDMLEPHLPDIESASESETNEFSNAEIESLIEAENWQQALMLVNELEAPQADMWKIRILIAQGDVDTAQKNLKALDESVSKSQPFQALQSLVDLKKIALGASGDLLMAINLLQRGEIDQGIQDLLKLLQKKVEDKNIRGALIAGFQLCKDAKTVSAYRRKMASMVF